MPATAVKPGISRGAIAPRGHLPPILQTVLAVLFLGLAAHPAEPRSDAPQAAEDSADYESEPDLAGLLDAVKNMEMREILTGLSVGTAGYAAFGIRIHVFDFVQDRFSLRVAEQKTAIGSRIREFLDRDQDVFAINGGYFELGAGRRLSASGLLIVDGRTEAQEHERAGSGVIYANANGVGIIYRKNFRTLPDVEQAVQVGPILVDPGGIKGIYKNVGGRFNRSAICLRGEAFTAFVVEGGISLFQLADLLSLPVAEGGFGCDIAINLDGGPSTQAVLRAGSTQTDVDGGTTVQNALVVSTKAVR